MYEINKVKNYRQFAELLEKKIECKVIIKVMSDKNHYHYQINDKYDMSLGVLCIDNGEASFAPFATHDNVKNSQFININHAVQFNDFTKLLLIFKEMFVEDVNTVTLGENDTKVML